MTKNTNPMANRLVTDEDGQPSMTGDEGQELDPQATGLAEAPKDESGITGGTYADPDPNPAFHNQQDVPGNADANPDLPEHTAYEEGVTPTGGHLV